MKHLKKFSFAILLIFVAVLSACRHNESDVNIKDTTILISGSVVEKASSPATSGSMNFSTSTNTSVAGIKYIAAIPTTGTEGIYRFPLDKSGGFSFQVKISGNYIFKLLDEYGLPQTELTFGDTTTSVMPVFSSTNLGTIEIGSNDKTALISNIKGKTKDEVGLVKEVVNSALKNMVKDILTENGKGKIVKTNNEEKIVLVIEEDSTGSSKVQERMVLKLDSVIDKYGELNFKDSLEVQIATVDATGNEVGTPVTMYTATNYLKNDDTNYTETTKEELAKIKTLIVKMNENNKQNASDFKTIVTAVNKGTAVNTAVSSNKNDASFTTISNTAKATADNQIKGDLLSIEITTQPTKLTYSMNDLLDTTGIVVKGKYANGNGYKEILDNGKLNFSGFDSSTVGTKTVTVTYGGKTATFNVTITINYKLIYSYTESNGEISINNYSGSDTVVTIPAAINGKPVTNIGNDAFYGKGLTSITIPDSITSIGNSAFMDNNLTSVIIPEKITKLGDNAFRNNKLATITIPRSVTSIGMNAFMYNSDLSKVIFDHTANDNTLTFNLSVIGMNASTLTFNAYSGAAGGSIKNYADSQYITLEIR